MEKHVFRCLVVVLLFPAVSLAADFRAFQRDLVQPYGLYKKSLALTSKAETKEKAEQTVQQFIEQWKGLAAKYVEDVPEPFAGLVGFDKMMLRPIEVGGQALVELADSDVAGAHHTLEEIRYLLWKMRVQANIDSLSDRVNSFHEAMEVVLGRIEETEEAAGLQHVGGRYGAWLDIEWERVAAAKVSGDDTLAFAKAVEEGRIAIRDLRKSLDDGNRDGALNAGRRMKAAYKDIFFLSACS